MAEFLESNMSDFHPYPFQCSNAFWMSQVEEAIDNGNWSLMGKSHDLTTTVKLYNDIGYDVGKRGFVYLP